MNIKKSSTIQLGRKCVCLINEHPNSYLIPILKGTVRARGMKSLLKKKHKTKAVRGESDG